MRDEEGVEGVHNSCQIGEQKELMGTMRGDVVRDGLQSLDCSISADTTSYHPSAQDFFHQSSIDVSLLTRRRKASMADEKEIFSGEIQEETVLENLGYQQELKRSFGLLGMVGFSFSIVTSWTALGSVLIIGVESGGPPVMIWSWIGISICALAVAYSMAEICSAYPVAGGQYSWVALLAPPKIARGMSWVTGWFMITGMRSVSMQNGS
jgi:amino acid permease